MGGDAEPNYDEATVRPLALPDPLLTLAGKPVASAAEWPARRAEIVGLFEEHVFGTSPPRPRDFRATIVSEEKGALNGLALRREIAVALMPGAPRLNLLLYLPAGAPGNAPLVLGANFLGNHTVANDPGIRVADYDFAATDRLPDAPRGEAARGGQADRWQAEKTLDRGYALATFWYGDLYPDRLDGRSLGIQRHVDPAGKFTWGALATWAWSMSLALDALAALPGIDASRIMLFGHSRHGKAALWASALDPRFAIVVSNNSGKGGDSLMRRNYGETVRHLVMRFPHWFAARYADYADREDRMPVDNHMLLTLTAPRPLYVASAEDDRWADPKGQFLSAVAATPVWRLLGKEGLPATSMPPLETPVMGTIGYHIRRGGHGVTAYDWDRYLDFADRHFGRR